MKKKAKNDENAKTYFKWLKMENEKFDQAEQKTVPLIDTSEIEESLKDERKIKKFKDSKDNDDQDKVISLKSKAQNDEPKMKLEIPLDIYKKGATYQLNDCFYDSNGEFLYRIPGAVINDLTSSN